MRRIIPALTVLMMFAGSVMRANAQGGAEENAPKFEPAEVLSTVPAVYPPKAVNWGTVVLEAVIAPSGSVETIKVVRDLPGFTSSAVTAVRQWKFKPATLDGKPIRSVVPVAVSFAQPLLWHPG